MIDKPVIPSIEFYSNDVLHISKNIHSNFLIKCKLTVDRRLSGDGRSSAPFQ